MVQVALLVQCHLFHLFLFPLLGQSIPFSLQALVYLEHLFLPLVLAAQFYLLARLFPLAPLVQEFLAHPVVPYHDYTAAKAAALGLTRTLATDLGPDNITVNMVSGGLLRTTDASAATPEEVFDLIASGTPLRRATEPAELADAVVFFASPWARAVTGQNLIVDGGLVKG